MTGLRENLIISGAWISLFGFFWVCYEYGAAL
jgi:hypothetical protein